MVFMHALCHMPVEYLLNGPEKDLSSLPEVSNSDQ